MFHFYIKQLKDTKTLIYLTASNAYALIHVTMFGDVAAQLGLYSHQPGAKPDIFIWGGHWRGKFCNKLKRNDPRCGSTCTRVEPSVSGSD